MGRSPGTSGCPLLLHAVSMHERLGTTRCLPRPLCHLPPHSLRRRLRGMRLGARLWGAEGALGSRSTRPKLPRRLACCFRSLTLDAAVTRCLLPVPSPSPSPSVPPSAVPHNPPAPPATNEADLQTLALWTDGRTGVGICYTRLRHAVVLPRRPRPFRFRSGAIVSHDKE